MATKIGDAFVSIGARISEFKKKMAIVKASFVKSGKQLRAFGKKFKFIGIAAAAGLGLAVRSFAQFEAKMRNVNTIAKQNEDQFERTSEAVLLLSREMGKSPTELADALYDINSASFQGAEGLKVLEAAAVAGRAGVSDTATAAKAITSVLNAYSLSAEEAGDVSDILFKTVEKGVVTFPELSETIGTVVSTANAAKVPFDQVAAGIATMTKGGIKSVVATTALNRLMLAFIKPSEGMKEALKDVGAESGAALLESRGLAGAMQFVQERTGGAVTEVVKLVPGMRSMKAALSLTRDEGKAFAADLVEVADKTSRAGATQAAFKEQSKSLSFQLDRVKTTVATLAIRIGKKLAPAVRVAIDKFQEFVDFLPYLKATLKDIGARMILPFRLLHRAVSVSLTNAIITVEWFIKNVKDMFLNAAKFIPRVWGNAMDKFGFQLARVWAKVRGETWNLGKDSGTALMDGVKEGMADIPPLVTNAFDFKGIVDKFSTDQVKTWDALNSQIKAKVKDQKEAVQEASDEETATVIKNEKKKLAVFGFAEAIKKAQAATLKMSSKDLLGSLTGPTKKSGESKADKKAEGQRDKTNKILGRVEHSLGGRGKIFV